MPLEGAAVHINAFNFPVWGMLEKLAPTLLAGVPAIVKPATQTSYLTERVFRRIIESGLLPEGAVQLICGGVGDLFEHLTCQDVVSFTGSASTALKLRQHPAVSAHAVRFTAETDSLNSSILGPDAVAGTPELELFVREVVREMTVKAGQKCTAIRRRWCRRPAVAEVLEALRAALGQVVVGDPRLEKVRMGPLASLAQRREVLEQLGRLKREAEVVYGDGARPQLEGADAERGAFVAPTLLYCRDAGRARAVHSVEAFGPVCTLLPYEGIDDAIALARRGGGSLAGSIFSADDGVAARLVLGLAPFHGRVLVINRDCAKESTGHGSPLPHLVHGGPGRAGGGEEMGGIRGVLHYMQRTAVQGTPDLITAVTGRWVEGARASSIPGTHPFRKPFGAAASSATPSTPPSAPSPSRTSSASRRCRATTSTPTWTRRRRPATRCSAAAWRTGISWSRPRRACSSIRRTGRCSPTTASTPCASPSRSSPATASRCASPARRSRCARRRLRRGALGHRHHQPGRARRSPATTCSPW